MGCFTIYLLPHLIDVLEKKSLVCEMLLRVFPPGSPPSPPRRCAHLRFPSFSCLFWRVFVCSLVFVSCCVLSSSDYGSFRRWNCSVVIVAFSCSLISPSVVLRSRFPSSSCLLFDFLVCWSKIIVCKLDGSDGSINVRTVRYQKKASKIVF